VLAPDNEEIYGGKAFSSANLGGQLSNRVATHLRERILSGKLKNGQFLRIDAIAKALGVSMTPVREGLLMLQSESLVQLMPRRGFMVSAFSRQDVRDLFWVQATIAAELVSRATRNLSENEIKDLETLQDEYREAVSKGDQQREDRLGHEFHRRINLAAKSPHLAQLLGRLVRRLPIRFYSNIEGHLTHAVEYHQHIINAIKLRSAKSAASLMFEHLDSEGERLVAMLERNGLWEPSESDEKQLVGGAEI